MTLPGAGPNDAIDASLRCADCDGWGWRWEAPFIGAPPEWRPCRPCAQTGTAAQVGARLGIPDRSPDQAKYLLKCLAVLRTAPDGELAAHERAARMAGASEADVRRALAENPNR